MAVVSAFDKLRKVHSAIIAESGYIKEHSNRIGKNLGVIKKFVELFDNKISSILELEEKAIFPYLEKHFDKDGPLFVMTYSHDVIREEFERLRNALSKKDMLCIQKSTERLAETLKFHIEKEDSIIIQGAEKVMSKGQINNFSNMYSKLIRNGTFGTY